MSHSIYKRADDVHCSKPYITEQYIPSLSGSSPHLVISSINHDLKSNVYRAQNRGELNKITALSGALDHD